MTLGVKAKVLCSLQPQRTFTRIQTQLALSSSYLFMNKTYILNHLYKFQNQTHEILLKEGDSVDLTNDIKFYDKCSADLIFVDNRELVSHFKVGWEINFADGTFTLTATEKLNTNCIRCVVTKSGKLGNLLTVSFRFIGEYSQRDLLTKRDITILEFVKEYKVF